MTGQGVERAVVYMQAGDMGLTKFAGVFGYDNLHPF